MPVSEVFTKDEFAVESAIYNVLLPRGKGDEGAFLKAPEFFLADNGY